MPMFTGFQAVLICSWTSWRGYRNSLWFRTWWRKQSRPLWRVLQGPMRPTTMRTTKMPWPVFKPMMMSILKWRSNQRISLWLIWIETIENSSVHSRHLADGIRKTERRQKRNEQNLQFVPGAKAKKKEDRQAPLLIMPKDNVFEHQKAD